MAKRGPSPADKYVGGRILTRRRALGMKSREAWRGAWPYVPAGAEIRARHQSIGAGRLLHVAHVLDVPITFFFDGAPIPKLNGASRKKR